MDYNFLSVLKNAYKKWQNKPFVYEKNLEKYEYITFGEFIEHAVYFAEALLDSGLTDENILVIGKNSIKWMIADVAIASFVGSSTGLGANSDYKKVESVIDKLKPKAIVYDCADETIMKELEANYNTIVFVSLKEDYDKLIDIGKKLNMQRSSLLDFDSRDDTAFIKGVLTSGTTGEPKIVMLSQKNIFFGWRYLTMRTPLEERDRCYLFLPLYHTYGVIYNFIYSFLSGMSIYLSSSISNIVEELVEVRPTVFSGVPYIYEKIYQVTNGDVSTVFGNHVRYLFNAGAKLSATLKRKYRKCGLHIISAYALSETAASLSIGYPQDNEVDSQGTIFEDLDVIIDDPNEQGYGEVFVKGDNLFLGYYGDVEATKQSFSAEGYFMTGDIGRIDDKNRIFIIGRTDNKVSMPNGKQYRMSTWKESNNEE